MNACSLLRSHTRADGSTILINVSPFVDFTSNGINAHSSPDLRFFMYQVLSYLSSEAISTRLLMHPDTGTLLYLACCILDG